MGIEDVDLLISLYLRVEIGDAGREHVRTVDDRFDGTPIDADPPLASGEGYPASAFDLGEELGR
jgi:hypothetical protein